MEAAQAAGDRRAEGRRLRAAPTRRGQQRLSTRARTAPRRSSTPAGSRSPSCTTRSWPTSTSPSCRSIGAVADHPEPGALLARPGGRGRGRPGRRPAVLRRRRRATTTAFYGQLAAAKAGQTTISLGQRPGDHRRRPRALRGSRADPRRADAGRDRRQGDLFKRFVAGHRRDPAQRRRKPPSWSTWPAAYGDQDLSMRVVRDGRPARLHPARARLSAAHAARASPAAPRPAFVLGITRQESGFDPARPLRRRRARHDAADAGAPPSHRSRARRAATARGELEDADYNMRLGSAYLGQLVNQFSGSYVMAAAGLQRRPRPADRVGRLLRRPARRPRPTRSTSSSASRSPRPATT